MATGLFNTAWEPTPGRKLHCERVPTIVETTPVDSTNSRTAGPLPSPGRVLPLLNQPNPGSVMNKASPLVAISVALAKRADVPAPSIAPYSLYLPASVVTL